MGAWTPARLKAGFSGHGGGQIIIHEVDSTGAALSTGTTGYYDCGIITETTWKDTTPYTPEYDEAGKKFASTPGNRDISITGTFAQRDSTITTFPKSVRDKYYLAKIDRGIVGSSTVKQYHEQFIFGQFDPNTEIPLPGGKSKFTFNAETNDGAITIALTTATATGTAGFSAHATATVTIAAVTEAGDAGYYEDVFTTVT
jgi:hypothetical protein